MVLLTRDVADGGVRGVEVVGDGTREVVGVFTGVGFDEKSNAVGTQPGSVGD